MKPIRIPRLAVIAGALVIAVVAFVSWRLSGGGDASLQNMPMNPVGSYQVGVLNAPDPPSMGDNSMTVMIRDAQGNPVRAAELETVVSMTAMGAMPYMESRGKVKEVKPGMYRAEYGLSMNGEWDVRLSIRAPQQAPARADYRLSTSIRGLSFVSSTPAQGGPGSPAPQPSGGSSAPPPGHAGHGAPGGQGMVVPAEEIPPGEDEVPGAITLDAARRQLLGIRTESISVRELAVTIRAPGRVAYDEAHQAEVSLRFSGWVREIRAATTGQAVNRGSVLFTAYSPEVWTAQQEFVEALKHSAVGTDTPDIAAGTAPADRHQLSPLAAAARQRLHLWDIPASEIARLERTRLPRETIPIVSPVSGVVTAKNIVQGSPFSVGQVLYTIARIDPVWVLASIHQVDLPLVRVGTPARILDPYLDANSRSGRVSFVYPAFTSETRTGTVRIEVANPQGKLKPGMFVDVNMMVPLGKKLALPESAVLPTGERNIVFVDAGAGRLVPRSVQLGYRAGDYFQVLAGLEPGEVVVTSGNFLVAAESKLRSATGKW